MQSGAGAGDLFEDVRGFGCPHEGHWVLVVVVDVVADSGDQLLEFLEGAAPDLVCCQIAEEPFDHVEPRGRGGREAHVEAFVVFEPALDATMLVGRVVVADQIDLLVSGDGLVDHTQEEEPFLMAVPLLIEPINLAGSSIEGGEQGGGAVVRRGG